MLLRFYAISCLFSFYSLCDTTAASWHYRTYQQMTSDKRDPIAFSWKGSLSCKSQNYLWGTLMKEFEEM